MLSSILLLLNFGFIYFGFFFFLLVFSGEYAKVIQIKMNEICVSLRTIVTIQDNQKRYAKAQFMALHMKLMHTASLTNSGWVTNNNLILDYCVCGVCVFIQINATDHL